MGKTKVSFRIDDDEAYVVAPVWFWNNMLHTYRTLEQEADDLDDAAYWRGVKEHIQDWVDQTASEGEEEDAI